MTVCLWYVSLGAFVQTRLILLGRDINSYARSSVSIEPINVFRGHNSVVGVRLMCSSHFRCSYNPQDVDWHSTQENLFASVGDDKMLML